ncbi:MAG: hypothetical protein Fur0044_44390 [Anaerolineae bacterium]|nr:hypothetical protein [Anaerolineales bacterium]MCQ3972013.1 hypothetical protein [Anaerolineae bacterium]
MKISSPTRVKHTYIQTLAAPPEAVFPLLCPVREAEWVEGWDPRLVISESGVAELDCIFIMPGQPHEAIWVVTRWEPQDYFIEFLKITPGVTVGRIDIQLRPGEAQQTLAEVSYAYTALSEAGERFIETFTVDHYIAFMQEWEAELNHFLTTGHKKAETPHP